MIKNPYPPPKEEDKISCRFQTYLSGEDKGLLSSIRPIRGTPQAVVNHLIKNLCNDLRDLNITQYHPDADDIFAVLVEPRKLTADQLSRIRRTLTGNDKQISTRIQHDSRGSGVRKRLASTSLGADHIAGKTVRGKQHDSEKKSSKATKAKDDGR